MSEDARPRRRYDASGRREQAERTRERVVQAAAEVFVEHGWSGATVPAIAERAGVALQTVYRAAPGKAGLLEAAVRAAVAGGAARARRPVEDRPAVRAVVDEPDAARRLAAYVRTQPGIWSRVGPVLRVALAAAPSEPALREFLAREDAQRLDGMTRMAGLLRDSGDLRVDLTPERAADVVVTLCSLATYESLVLGRGWTHEEYRAWLTETLQAALLG